MKSTGIPSLGVAGAVNATEFRRYRGRFRLRIA